MRSSNVTHLLYLLIFLFIEVIPLNVNAQKTTDEDLTVEFQVYVDGKRAQTTEDLVKMFFATGPADMDEEQKKEFPRDHSENFFVEHGKDVLIKKGESAQLKVDMIEKDGTITDVTDSPDIIYEGYDQELLSVNKNGMITAASQRPDEKITFDHIRIIFHHGDKLGYDTLTIRVID